MLLLISDFFSSLYLTVLGVSSSQAQALSKHRLMALLRARLHLAVTVAMCMTAGALNTSTLSSYISTTTKNAPPAILASVNLQIRVAEIQSAVTQSFLQQERDDKDTSYTQYRLLSKALQEDVARSVDTLHLGQSDRVLLTSFMDEFSQYTEKVGGIILKPAELKDIRAVRQHLEERVLPSAKKLEALNVKIFDTTFASAQSSVHMTFWLQLVAGLLLLGALYRVQRLHTALFARIFNPMTLGATALAVLVVGLMTLQSWRLERTLTDVKTEAFESLEALHNAKNLAQMMSVHENALLLNYASPELRVKNQESFDKNAAKMANPNLFGEHVVGIKAKRYADFKSDGLLGRAISNITFPSEAAALEDAMYAYHRYLDSHTEMMDALSGESFSSSAASAALTSKTGTIDFTFQQFMSALDHAITINQDVFDSEEHHADSLLWTLRGLDLLFLLVFALTYFGLRPRVNEYLHD
jgi:hypothetical protein